MVTALRDALGPCSVLVANAGLIERASILDLSPERWQRMLDVTLKGPFLCAREVAPAMIAMGWGRIVTISSDAGKRGGQATGPHYSAAKAGVLGLMRGMALQLAPHGITVNDVCPVDIPVERWQGRSDEQLAATLAGIPTGRFGAPSDVAAAVAFLASEDARHVTGVSLDVSGGAILT
jgi:NAD(P)-dependent dehydrogenase (short-subunit alcohol dehydrogenase family)